MTKKLLASLALASGMSTAAYADDVVQGSGAFIEPGVTYSMMESNLNFPNSASQASVKGFGAVVRGGVHVFERFFIAADARYGFENEYNDNANSTSVKASSWDIAPTVGVQMADYGVRLYGGYILAGNLDPKGVNGADLRFEDPTGWRIGAGLKLQQLSVNIEWQTINYGKTTLSSNPAIATDDIEFDGDGIVASVTFPIEFE